MTATAVQIAQLRRMINEPTEATYDAAALAAYIEARPTVDEAGQPPKVRAGQVLSLSGSVSTTAMVDNPLWTPTYDLNAAAADLWEEKAAPLAQNYDVNADGANLARSQAFQQAMQQARHYRSRRRHGTITLVKSPDESLLGDVL